MKKALITGASGLTGSELVKLLLASGVYSVCTIGRTPVAGTDFVPMDFTLPIDSERLPRDIDVVFHLAQSDSHNDFPAQGKSLFDANVASTFALLDYARTAGAKKFIYASSGGIYAPSDEALREDSEISPDNRLSFYLNTKICGEGLCNAYKAFFDVIRLRPFFIYGSGQKPYMFMQRMMHSVASGEAITLNGEDGIRLNPIHVKEAAMCFYSALLLEGSCAVNVAGAEILSIREIAESIGHAMGKEPIFTRNEKESKDIVASTEKMRELLHCPKICIMDGILGMLK